ncbi:MAG: alpha/beta hydrolase [Herpetosiphonaceae bacterium]|nr:alpha/beta hydrolase [Herpetosiphonaceae bacterium]
MDQGVMARIGIDGLQFHYLDTGNGAAVLFVHGNIASSRWWLPTIERLPTGFRAVALDMRGYGLSDKPGTGYTITQRSLDLHDFITQLNLGRVHLVGHSLGGAVALQFTIDYPTLVRSLTLLASAPIDGMVAPRSLEAAIPTLLGNRAMFIQALRRSSPTGPFGEAWERLVDDGLLTDQQAWIDAGRTLGTWNVERQVMTFNVPTQIVHGAADAVALPSTAEYAAHTIKGAQLNILEGIGHSPHVERPEEWTQQLVAFLNAHP